MPKQTTVGALVVVYYNGPKSTYRWVDQWTYQNIVLRDLQSAQEQLAKAKKQLPVTEAAARSMSEREFRQAYGISSVEALRMLRDPIGVSTMTLRTIETEPAFKGTYLGHGPTLRINFKDVKNVAFKETRKVDDFGP